MLWAHFPPLLSLLPSFAATNPAPTKLPLGGLSRDAIPQDLFDEFDELSKIVDIAYCVGSPNTGIDRPFKCLSYCRNFPTFELQKTWNTGPTLQDSCGYVALSHPPAAPRIIVAFRGTYSIVNAIADLSLTKQKYEPYPPEGRRDECKGCGVHSGFFESWQQSKVLIEDLIQELVMMYPEYQLTLVGHSLGGAVAALAGLDFHRRGWEPVVTTFGEPKVGNKQLAKYFDKKFTPETYRRVTHVKDPVPRLPLSQWGFSQHAYEYYISNPQLPYTRGDVQLCEGDEDPGCIMGGDEVWNAFQLLLAHRDYFHRVGLCVPEDSLLRRIGLLESDGGEL